MLVVEQEMLYYASAVMGQSLMKNMQGKNEIRREALVCFVNACRYGKLIHFLVCEELVAFSGRRPPLLTNEKLFFIIVKVRTKS